MILFSWYSIYNYLYNHQHKFIYCTSLIFKIFLKYNVFTLVWIHVPFKELNTKAKLVHKYFLTIFYRKSANLSLLVQVNKFIYQFRFWSNVQEATASTYICQIPPYYHIMLKNQNIIYVKKKNKTILKYTPSSHRNSYARLMFYLFPVKSLIEGYRIH